MRFLRNIQNQRRFSRCYSQTHIKLHDTSTSVYKSAIGILKLSNNPNFSARELRDAYFSQAKLCHPDSSPQEKTNISKHNSPTHFHKINDAYDFLLKHRKSSTNFPNESTEGNDDHLQNFVSKTEEEMFREACREYLGEYGTFIL